MKGKEENLTDSLPTLLGLQEPLFSVSLVKGTDYHSVLNGCIAATATAGGQPHDWGHQKNEIKIQNIKRKWYFSAQSPS